MREVLSLVLFITVLPLIHGFSKCSANEASCADEGVTCTINATLYMNTTDPTRSVLECLPAGATCCKQGLYCIAGTCKSDNNGASCNTKSDCYPGDSVTTPYDCWKGFCKVFGVENDECDTDEDCWAAMTCSENRCIGFQKGDYCQSSEECTYGFYCSQDNSCQQNSDAGGYCSGTVDTTCITGTFCDPNQQRCQYEYSQALDDPCLNSQAYACGVGLTCDNTTFKCTNAVTQLKSCSSDADCAGDAVGSQCICFGDGSSACSNEFYVVCQAQVKDWRNCLGKNQCSKSYFTGSCAFRSCATQWTELNNCMCDEWKRVYGSTCAYSWCSKPVSYQPYQIGIIVIISLMGAALVITIIVFVVRHFMSPDNPYYQAVELPATKKEETQQEHQKEEEHFVELHD